MKKNTARRPPHNQKITDEQAEEIARLYVDEGYSLRELAEMYGVAKSSIYLAISRGNYTEKLKNLREARFATAQLRVLEQVDLALDRNEEILKQQLDPQYQYLWQNASRDTLDRAGVKAAKEDKQDITITFSGGGFNVGMPDKVEDEEPDGADQD